MAKTLAELVKERKASGPIRKKRSDEEHDIQCACKDWFNLQYKQYRGLLFAVPNGGKRDEITAAKLLAEGVYPGVSDLILLKKSDRYGALLIEMKNPKGTLSKSQKEWSAKIEVFGEYKYVICRSLEDFIREVNEYLKG